MILVTGALFNAIDTSNAINGVISGEHGREVEIVPQYVIGVVLTAVPMTFAVNLGLGVWNFRVLRAVVVIVGAGVVATVWTLTMIACRSMTVVLSKNWTAN